MHDATPAAVGAMSAQWRDIKARAIIDAVDPDIIFLTSTTSAQAPGSNPAQLYDRMTTAATIATLEPCHFPLNGTAVLPRTTAMTEQVGAVSNARGSTSGTMSGIYAQVNMSGVDKLSLCTVCFSDNLYDGYAENFTVTIYSGSSAVQTVTVTGNRAAMVRVTGLTVYNATGIRVTPTKWSRPHTRARVIEIVPGAYEVVTGRDLYAVETYAEIDLSLMTLPFGTATIRAGNADKRFDPRNRDGIFPAIEARQRVPVEYDILLPDGNREAFPAGVYYQQTEGWTLENDNAIMRFNVVDIIGLIRDRRYRPPATLPTALNGWIASIVAQSGVGGDYYIDPAYADAELTATQDDVRDITCGELLRYACMAVGVVPLTDAATGQLRVVTAPDAVGAAVPLHTLNKPPSLRANIDIASITFTLNDAQHTQVVISGTNSAADTTLSVNNLFIRDTAHAQAVARRILRYYGGQRITAVGIGDLRAELGDVESVEIAPGEYVGGQRIKHKLSVTDGMMYDTTAEYIQPTGDETYSTSVVIRSGGNWTAPAGVTRIRIMLIHGGYGGDGGNAGDQIPGSYGGHPFDGAGRGGNGGRPGRVFIATIDINPQQVFAVTIGQGGNGGAGGVLYAAPEDLFGKPGAPGTATTFGAFTSDAGNDYEGVIDIVTGNVFAQSGNAGANLNATAPIPSPRYGYGDGGNGGNGGRNVQYYTEQSGNIIVTGNAENGTAGTRGGTGCVIVSYDL